MMVLHPPDRPSMRRRRSKGTIAGYVEKGPPNTALTKDAASSSSAPTAAALKDQQKPSYTAPLVLLCVQNALRINPQMYLCPPGRARRELQAMLQQENDVSSLLQNNSASSSAAATITTSVFSYPKQPEITDDADEDASSADEDDLLGPNDPVVCPPSVEPLYIPAGTDPQNTKLPFNRRKIRYFDAVTANEQTIARNYCKKQIQRSKQRHAAALMAHLKQMQRQERIRLGMEVPPENDADADTNKNTNTTTDDNEQRFTPLETPMTPALSAALLLEALQVNPMESLEGMAKCYHGIVAAGMALLEDPNADILSALTPLLITSLEETSGQVILQLAQLKRMCGTARYQRRLVQRIAPLWIRPSTSATWSLQHQHDMPAILAAAEFILDCAEAHIFTKGWYERGRMILADSARAKTLDSAAQQLRIMGQDAAQKSGFAGSSGGGGSGGTGTSWLSADHAPKNLPLQDWEVGAVVRQIKVSITVALKTDWSKVVSQEVPRPSYRRPYKRESPKTPRSPPRTMVLQPKPQSPPNIPTEAMENVFGPAFVDRASSPPPPEVSPRLALPKSPKSPVSRDAMPQPPLSPKRPKANNMNSGAVLAASSPLSPSASSVGTNASTEIVTYRPTVTTPAATNYRLLTSTAAERKRTVAACRALRAQIQRFEDAFVQLHGRPPKGNAERAPLATTYAQYREWKRAIRADAACRIQALVRGAQTRSLLLRNGFLSSRILLKRPGRPGAANIMNQISIPVEIGEQPASESSSFAASQPPTLAPQWASTVVRRRSEEYNSPSRRSAAANAVAAADGNLSNMTLDELQSRKRELKRQLKQYDMNFARRHGRMPVKAEKEPIRHLYENYNALKNQIGMAETNSSNRTTPSPTAATSRSDSPSESLHSGGEDSPSPSPVLTRRRMDLHALKAEKSQLHQMLRSYERDFFEEHRRQVSSFSDIRPVASQYRRYKEIKRAIAALQGNS